MGVAKKSIMSHNLRKRYQKVGSQDDFATATYFFGELVFRWVQILARDDPLLNKILLNRRGGRKADDFKAVLQRKVEKPPWHPDMFQPPKTSGKQIIWRKLTIHRQACGWEKMGVAKKRTGAHICEKSCKKLLFKAILLRPRFFGGKQVPGWIQRLLS